MRGWRTFAQDTLDTGARHWHRARVVVKKKIRALLTSNSSLALQVRLAKWKKAHRLGHTPVIIDEKRRAFLKYAVFGGVVFLIGKYIDPLINLLRGDTVVGEKSFEHFKYVETGREIRVTDDEGAELLTIDKEGF